MALPEYPITREEYYLAQAAGEDVVLPEQAITRKELYLAKIAGENVTTPDPETREEMYLDYIAENGSGGGDIESASGQSF